MREYDDDIQSYAPVLKRIIILVAVITAVPVVLWTITAFMRTYIAQPTILGPKPLAVATSTVTPTSAPDTTAANNPTPAASATAPVSADDAGANNGSGNPPDNKMTTASLAQGAPAPAATAAPWPAAPSTAAAQAAPAPAAPNVFPDPPAFAAQPAPQPAAPTAAPDATTADDSLPPPDPINGPVPMPRHRPAVFALAENGPVPLPRARPTDAPEPPKTVNDAPAVFDPGIGGGVSGAH